jgi:hypothetical protein
MSILLRDRVWTMLSEVAKRGVYPLHGNKLGIYRIPLEITQKSEIQSILNDLRSSGFKMDTHADRIYVTYKWTEIGVDPVTGKELSADLNRYRRGRGSYLPDKATRIFWRPLLD